MLALWPLRLIVIFSRDLEAHEIFCKYTYSLAYYIFVYIVSQNVLTYVILIGSTVLRLSKPLSKVLWILVWERAIFQEALALLAIWPLRLIVISLETWRLIRFSNYTYSLASYISVHVVSQNGLVYATPPIGSMFIRPSRSSY